MDANTLEKSMETLWVKVAIKECYQMLNENKEADAIHTYAGSLISTNKTQEYQVQIIITRKEEDFLGDFDYVTLKTM